MSEIISTTPENRVGIPRLPDMPGDRQKIILLGATGSIGQSTLKILRQYPEKFELVGISYHNNHQKAIEICREFHVQHVYCSSDHKGNVYNWATNHESYSEILSIEYHSIIIAVVGSAGVQPTYIAASQGKKILLANKESLVMAGEIITETAMENHAQILPVDSEHNSIFRLLRGIDNPGQITITASGGALRNRDIADLKNVTVQDVLNHPTWNMGAKITVDSATMVNKSLEIIEACHLFNKKCDEINAVVHPESFVHAIIKHKDGSLFFHVYRPDMIYSIAYCLFYPDSAPPIAESIEAEKMPNLTFTGIDPEKYPGYYLGIKAGQKGGVYPAIFNAANEQAVNHFLNKQIGYLDIIPAVQDALDHCTDEYDKTMESLHRADSWARNFVFERVKKIATDAHR